MTISFSKSCLAFGLATLIATPAMSQQNPPSSDPPQTEQEKPGQQDPKPADAPQKSAEQSKQDQQQRNEQKQTQDQQTRPKQTPQKPDQPAADPKAAPQSQAKDRNLPNAQRPNPNSNVNVNVQQNNTQALSRIQFFNVTTLPERIRVEQVYRIYEVRDTSGTFTVEGTMGEKRKIYLNDDVFLVTNLKEGDAREYPVLLGKESALQKLNLQKGDRIKVEGHDGVVNERHMLVAFRVTRQGNTVYVKLGPDGTIIEHEVAKPIGN